MMINEGNGKLEKKHTSLPTGRQAQPPLKRGLIHAIPHSGMAIVSPLERGLRGVFF